MLINRDIYLNRIVRKKHNGLIKVITGIRRCGKSYLLNTLFKNHLIGQGVPRDHIITIALDRISICQADSLVALPEQPVNCRGFSSLTGSRRR